MDGCSRPSASRSRSSPPFISPCRRPPRPPCSCSPISFATNTPAGTGTTCTSATASLQAKIQDAEIAACAPYNFCNLQPIVITSPCQLQGGSYVVQGYQRYSCYVGTTCPNGF